MYYIKLILIRIRRVDKKKGYSREKKFKNYIITLYILVYVYLYGHIIIIKKQLFIDCNGNRHTYHTFCTYYIIGMEKINYIII